MAGRELASFSKRSIARKPDGPAPQRRSVRLMATGTVLLALLFGGFSLPALAGNCLVTGNGKTASGTGFPTTLTNITIEAWVYHDDMPSRRERYVTVGNEVAVLRMDGVSSPGQLHFYIKTSGTLRHLRVNGALSADGWHHVAGTWNGTTMVAYLDGNPAGSATPGGSLDAPDGTISLNHATEYLDGRLDEVRVWSTARTQTQIQTDMHIGLSGSESGLIGYWRLDEASGTAAYDSSATGLDLTVSGGAQFAVSDAPVAYGGTGGSGNALTFDGISQYVSIPDADDLDLTTNYTLEAWFRANSFGPQGDLRGLISKYQNPATNGYMLRLNGTNLNFDQKYTSGLVLQTGVWYHVAGVNDNGTRHLYLNGIEQTLGGSGLAVSANTDELRLASDYSGRYFDGRMDEVRIWSVVRGADQIRDDMHQSVAGSEPGLVAYYNFDQGQGTTLPDIAPNGHAGTLVNMTEANWIASTVPFANLILGRNSIRGAWTGNTTSLFSGRLGFGDAVLADPHFAVFGHDAGTDGWQSSDVPPGMAGRLTRIWQAEVSGSVSGDLLFDITGIGGSDLSLLQSADGTFAAATVIPGTLVDTTFTANGQSPSNGSYFTLGMNTLPPQHTVTPSAGTNGTISPDTPQSVVENASAAFVIKPDANYRIVVPVGGTCGGAYTGDPYDPVNGIIFTTDPITGDCTVTAAFDLVPLTDIGAGLPGLSWSSAAWGDYDSDGNLDFILTGYTGSTRFNSIYHNNGDGTFSDIAAGLPGVSSGSVAWGDYDNDGNLDLLLTGYDGSAPISRVYHNDGGGLFTDIGAGLPGVYNSAVAWGDYDNDGRLDFILTGQNTGGARYGRIYHNDGGGAFTDIAAGLPEVSYGSVAWGDYNNDGNPDFILTGFNGSSNISRIYRNNGDGSFADIAAGLPGVEYGSVAWGDYDNDGRLDFVLAGTDGGNYVNRIYHNNGGGAFIDVGAGLPGIRYDSVAWGDYDNDGRLDLVVTGRFASGTRIATLYHNDGGDTFTDALTNLPGVLGGSAAWGDYDNDGRLDLLLAGESTGGYISRIYHNHVMAADTPPTAPSSLFATGALLSWDAASDDQTPANGLSYNLRIGTAPGLSDVLSGMADTSSGQRRIPALGIAYENRTWTPSGLPPGIYYWSVQAVDSAFAGGPWAPGEWLLARSGGNGDALTFDGTNQYVSISDANDLDMTTRYTLEVWFKADSLGGWRGLISKWQTSGANGWYLALHNTGLVFDDMQTSGVTLQPGLWYHVAAVNDNGARHLYLDGVERTLTGTPLAVQSNYDPVRLGSDYGAEYLAGRMDEARIWNVARTADQIRDDMHRGLLAGSGSGLVAYYTFNQGSGTTLSDETPNGHTGTLMNMTETNWVDSTIPFADVIRDRANIRGVWSGNLTSLVSDRFRVSSASVADPDFVIFGHDQKADAWQSNDVPSGVLRRLTRIWRTEVSGSVSGDAVFDITGLGGADLSLLRSSDGTFATATVIPGTLVGTTFTASGQSLSNGSYYTLGMNTLAPQFTVTPSAGANGTISPDVPQSVFENAVTTFVIKPDTGYRVIVPVGGTCGGSYAGDPEDTVNGITYTTGFITGDCAVTATFFRLPFTNSAGGLQGVAASAASWGDYDNDGDLDVILAGATSSSDVSLVYRNNGNGTFTDIGAGLPGVETGSAAWGDYDNDGNLDLLLTGLSGAGRISRIYHNNGDGTFADIAAGLPGVETGSAAWGDYDNDGRLDLILAGRTDNTGTLITRIYHNSGGGTFADVGAGLPGIRYGSVAWGDYDNDGRLDLILVGNDGSTDISRIYHNNGSGAFADIAAGLPGVDYGAAAWGDYDNDGRLDLVLIGNGISRIYHNNGGGVFADIGAGLPGVTFSSAAWGDYDNDGRLDLVLTGDNSSTRISRIYHNNGDGTFTDIAAGLPGVDYSSVAWGDYDNDGKLDFILTGWPSSDYISRIYHNEALTANTPPTTPAGLSATVSNGVATLNWNAASDSETPANGLSYNLRVGTTPGGSDTFSGMADATTGFRRVAALGSADMNLAWSLQLTRGSTYYWSVQAMDSAFAGGPWPTEQSFYVSGSAGEASRAAGSAMTAVKGSGTSVTLNYTPANCASDHAVYWGESPISGSLAWSGAACPQGVSGTASLDPGDPPPGGFYYFVIVGNNGTKEGSYGQDSSGVERPEAGSVVGCNYPQQLTGTCP